MFRDLMISFAGHVVVVSGLLVASMVATKPRIPIIDVYQVRAVSSSSITELLTRNAPVTQKPTPNVPQITVTETPLPQENRKPVQVVKQTTPQSATTVTKTETPAEPVEESSGVSGIVTDTKFEHPEYLLELRDRIQANWRVPVLRTSAATRVYFTIGRDGRLLQVYVEQPTGTVAFDSSALQAVIACDPFPPLPEEYESETLGVHFDFIYELD